MIKKIIFLIIPLILSCTSVQNYEAKNENIKLKNILKENQKIDTKKIDKQEIYGKELLLKVKLSSKHNNYRGKIYNKNGNRINEVLLEEYLYSVVASEMPTKFDIEALKAQAIASRTYAVYNILYPKNKYFDLYDTTQSQVYKGTKVEIDKVKKAVDETRGIIITYSENPINALYHASAGNKTNSSLYYYGKNIEYLQSVEDFTENITWEKSINKEKFLKMFDMNNLNKRKVREKLKLRSANFEIEIKSNTVVLKGMGYGHGVGMSQYGANEMAKVGYTYDEILKHYYTDIELKKIY